jgi:hypothetical protein
LQYLPDIGAFALTGAWLHVGGSQAVFRTGIGASGPILENRTVIEVGKVSCGNGQGCSAGMLKQEQSCFQFFKGYLVGLQGQRRVGEKICIIFPGFLAAKALLEGNFTINTLLVYIKFNRTAADLFAGIFVAIGAGNRELVLLDNEDVLIPARMIFQAVICSWTLAGTQAGIPVRALVCCLQNRLRNGAFLHSTAAAVMKRIPIFVV